jgi:putative transposase
MLLEREGMIMNRKKLCIVYIVRKKLTVRKRSGRKRALGTRTSMSIPQEANQRWSWTLFQMI